MTIPKGNYVLLQPDPIEEVTAGGIIKATKSVPYTGVVLRVSEDAEVSVSVGDRVQYAPTRKHDNEDGTVLVSEDNILFVFN